MKANVSLVCRGDEHQVCVAKSTPNKYRHFCRCFGKISSNTSIAIISQGLLLTSAATGTTILLPVSTAAQAGHFKSKASRITQAG